MGFLSNPERDYLRWMWYELAAAAYGYTIDSPRIADVGQHYIVYFRKNQKFLRPCKGRADQLRNERLLKADSGVEKIVLTTISRETTAEFLRLATESQKEATNT